MNTELNTTHSYYICSIIVHISISALCIPRVIPRSVTIEHSYTIHNSFKSTENTKKCQVCHCNSNLVSEKNVMKIEICIFCVESKCGTCKWIVEQSKRFVAKITYSEQWVRSLHSNSNCLRHLSILVTWDLVTWAYTLQFVI